MGGQDHRNPGEPLASSSGRSYAPTPDHSGHAHHLHDHAAATTVDSVCGMKVDPSTARHKIEHHGKIFYFCSERCRTKFVGDPAKYAHGTAQHAQLDDVPAGKMYTCPMHPQIRQIGPGNCPICGMALEPVGGSAEAGPSPELMDMTRRFWIGTALAVPTVILEMGAHFPGLIRHYVSPQISIWLQFLLATPVALW